jgi:hypothetical protein
VLRTLFLMAISFALFFSVTTVLLLVRERFMGTKEPTWRVEDDLLRW